MTEEDRNVADSPTLYGHPTGLYTLFFAEMWERFSYYGMRALLVLYMIKGFLGYTDDDAYAVYGAYTALVYMTPFFGGMLADKLLGQRRAVLFGGLLMASGHLVMMFQDKWMFLIALGLLIVGNGFFKPNISTMVGELYPKGSSKRDGGFTLFYMGINLGAALAPLVCGYVGEKYGWHLGFGLATIGMTVGLAVFWAPNWLSQILILVAAFLTAGLMAYNQWGAHPVPFTLYCLIGIALLASAITAWRALGKGGLPDEVGRAPSASLLKKYEFVVYGATLLCVPALAWLIAQATADPWIPAFGDAGKPAGLILIVAGAASLVYLLKEAVRLDRVPRQKMFAALILIFFSMLFWAFFEQAGSSINNFTDRNVDRVLEGDTVKQADVGTTKEITLTQEQLGFTIAPVEAVYNDLAARVAARLDAGEIKVNDDKVPELKWKMNPSTLTAVAGGNSVVVDGFSWLWAKKNTKDDEETKINSTLDYEHELKISFPKKPESIKDDEEALAKSNKFWAQSSLEQAREVLGSPKFTLEKLNGAWNRAKERASVDEEVSLDLEKVAVNIPLTEEHVGMGIATNKQEMPASTFQAVNPTFIILFGLLFTMLWSWLAARNLEPSTPFKFALGLLQLALGFGALYMGAQGADSRGMVMVGWLVLGYLLHTTGELCLSPVGLSMITKLSPQVLVSTMMGMWFLATAFSNYLSAIIATFTGVSHGGGKSPVMPVPSETVHTYGGVFGAICVAALVCAALCFLLVPLLKKWMHDEANPGRGR